MLWSNNTSNLVRLALAEDAAHADLTSQLSVSQDHRTKVNVVARETLVFCHAGIANSILTESRADASILHCGIEGQKYQTGEILMTIEGRCQDLLAIERTLLNFLQRLSGVATYTAHVAEGMRAMLVLDTRKTTPGWRELEKFAVLCGGGRNHRRSLQDLILVKNNHIDANNGDVRLTLTKIRNGRGPFVPLEVEVRTMEELAVALEFKPDAILLDNMDNQQIGKAMELIRTLGPERPFIEVSGGVQRERLQTLQDLGVDGVSMGALTTAARWVDISMRVTA